MHPTVKFKNISPMCVYLFINYNATAYQHYSVCSMNYQESSLFVFMIKNETGVLTFFIFPVDCFHTPLWGLLQWEDHFSPISYNCSPVTISHCFFSALLESYAHSWVQSLWNSKSKFYEYKVIQLSLFVPSREMLWKYSI